MSDKHDNEVIRVTHDGRVYRWQRHGAAWPGHTSYIAIRTGQVVVGDRYRDEGFDLLHTCDPLELLDGCFHEVIADQFGPDVLDEVLAEVRAVYSSRARAPQPAQPDARPARAIRVAGRAPTAGDDPPAAQQQASDAAHDPPAAQQQASGAADDPPAAQHQTAASGRVTISLIGCKTMDLPLAVELRAITRAPVKRVVDHLDRLPCVLVADIPVAEARTIEQRLTALGATVELRG